MFNLVNTLLIEPLNLSLKCKKVRNVVDFFVCFCSNFAFSEIAHALAPCLFTKEDTMQSIIVNVVIISST